LYHSLFSCKFDTGTCTGTGPICGDGFVQAGVEQCDPPGPTCSATCQFISSSSGTVVGTTTVPQFCGIKQLTVTTPPAVVDFTSVELDIIFGETVNNQVSDEQTARFSNTGSGDAEVTVDFTAATGPGNDGDGETTDWEDLNFDFGFSECNTRFSSVAATPYAFKSSICGFTPFIQVLPGRMQPELPADIVDRFISVRPTVSDANFAGPPMTDLVTFTQVLRLEVSCDPAAECSPGTVEVNGACLVPDQ